MVTASWLQSRLSFLCELSLKRSHLNPEISGAGQITYFLETGNQSAGHMNDKEHIFRIGVLTPTCSLMPVPWSLLVDPAGSPLRLVSVECGWKGELACGSSRPHHSLFPVFWDV